MSKLRTILVIILTVSLLFLLPAPPCSAEETETDQAIHTLEDQTIFSGRCEPGTLISCSVYTYQNGRDRILLYQSRQRVEESGLYCLRVPLPLIGTQFIHLEIGEEELLVRGIRYPRSLVEEITNYQLNLYDYLIENGQISPGGRP